MLCEQTDCRKEAVAIAHWGGKDIKQCEEHCKGINTLSHAMGHEDVIFTEIKSGITMKMQPLKKITMFDTISLGGLIQEVENSNVEGKDVMFDFGWALPTHLDSYRGYYDHLALGYSAGGDYIWEKPLLIKDFLKELKEAVGKTYEGWKGGNYVMDLNTPVWVDNSGHCSGTRILGIQEDTHTMIIQTRTEEV